MTIEQNKSLVLTYLEAISGKEKPDVVVQRFVSDPELRDHIARSEAAFPHYRMEADDVIAEGDRVVVRFTAHVHHQGDFMGLPPTGRKASMAGIIIYRIAGEKIVEHWMQIDAIALMQQLTAEQAVPGGV